MTERAMLRASNICGLSRRSKSFRVKQKWASMPKFKTGAQLALEHFDFFYRPIYQEYWPSIRLGLLSDPKYVAVVNNYSNPREFTDLLSDLGSLDLLGLVAERNRLHRLRLPPEAPASAASTTPSFLRDEPEEEAENPEEWDEAYRGQEALGEFVTSGGRLSRDSLQRLDPDTRSQMIDVARVVNRERPLEMRTVEDDLVEYPTALRVMGFPRGDISLFPQAEVGPGNTLGWYLMDGASLLPVLALNLRLGDEVLDMCAAPGGKSVVILQTMLPRRLVCNDNQVGRLNRLRNTLLAYIPEKGTASDGGVELRDRITLSRSDAAKSHWCEEEGHTEAYDKVLVDAPCTTDRHALHIGEGSDGSSIFRRSRSAERLALPQAQTRLLFNALQATKPDGAVVYSTCSLSPLQNESVVEAAVDLARERLGQDWALVDLKQMAEDLSTRAGLFRLYPHTRFGLLVLPFLPLNYGPMYIAKLRRIK